MFLLLQKYTFPTKPPYKNYTFPIILAHKNYTYPQANSAILTFECSRVVTAYSIFSEFCGRRFKFQKNLFTFVVINIQS